MPIGNGNNDDDDSTYLEFCEVLIVDMLRLKQEGVLVCYI